MTKSMARHQERAAGELAMSSLKTIGIIGAGQMGCGIAHVSAVAGYKVHIHDLSPGSYRERPRHHQWQPCPPRLFRQDERRGSQSGAVTHYRFLRSQRSRPGRSCHRGRDRGRKRQAQDLRPGLSYPEARGDARHQHLIAVDHAARVRDRPAGAASWAFTS